MVDYGHSLLFGTVLTPSAGQPQAVVERALLTEQVGLDLVSVSDHPYHAGFLDAWTLLSVIAARTGRVRVLPNVANLPLRPPAVLARSVASLDILSDGRAELGLGAGAYWDAIAAQGGPLRTPAEAVAALGEAIAVIRALWVPGPGYVEGRHYRLDGVEPGPFPRHDIGIWVGAIRPRMLNLIGRTADGWLPSSPRVPPHELAVAHQIIDEAAEQAGRTPQDVRRLYNIAAGSGFPRGPVGAWPEQLAELTIRDGVSGYLLATDSADAIRRFAGDVVPAVGELVVAERSGPDPNRSGPTSPAHGLRAHRPRAHRT
jgi:alkanesulfonate monooxygenase SsuD/methylene tetrahydromethanopterin reductase-like flavin-dependent oxidoreductase (luciferase family)